MALVDACCSAIGTCNECTVYGHFLHLAEWTVYAPFYLYPSVRPAGTAPGLLGVSLVPLCNHFYLYVATRAAGRTPMRGLARPSAEVV
jgi:hypothetical protein